MKECVCKEGMGGMRFRRHKGINFILSLDLFAPNISAKMSDTNKISIDSQTFCHPAMASALIS
jgi:hypothetical protein